MINHYGLTAARNDEMAVVITRALKRAKLQLKSRSDVFRPLQNPLLGGGRGGRAQSSKRAANKWENKYFAPIHPLLSKSQSQKCESKQKSYRELAL